MARAPVIIVIYGPAATRQVHNAEALASLYGVGVIVVDAQDEGHPFPDRNAIILTERDPDAISAWRATSLLSKAALIFVPLAVALRAIDAPPPAIAPSRRLTRDEHVALAYLAEGRCAATCRVAQTLWSPRARSTALARTLLRRLQRWGLVQGVTAPDGGNVFWWQITDAGRKAVRP